MNLTRLTQQLTEIYDDFERAATGFKAAAVCRIGCAFCCTTVGDVDITTLEGIIIRGHLASLPKKLRLRLEKAVSENHREKLRETLLPCPFLTTEKTCAIYPVRPFSCRRLYSVKPCGETGPTLHREAAALSEASVTSLQRLDDTGYSGHISHILQLLALPRFRKQYLSGEFDPAEILDFGKAHRIRINRFTTARPPAGPARGTLPPQPGVSS